MNKKINKILACVDFSDYALMVLDYSVALAKGSNTQIVVYNVINQRDVNLLEKVSPYAYGKISVKDYVRDQKKKIEGMIKGLIKKHFFEEKSIMSFKIDVGIPYEAILETIKTENIDLVVMANKGWENIEMVLFGNTAEKVFRHSPVPVVSVRDKKRFEKER